MTTEAADARVWAYSKDGEAKLFDSAAEVPAGWSDTPAKDPLDHDGDGKKGGSKPKAKAR